MLTSLLSALCAITLSAAEVPAAAPAQVDTLNNYIINDIPVNNFDGSQLTGKIISEYKIVENKVGKNVIKTHLIKTGKTSMREVSVVESKEISGDLSKIVVRGAAPGAKLMYIIDDKPASEEEFSKLSPNDIKSIEVLKNSSATAISGDKETGVLKIYTRNSK